MSSMQERSRTIASVLLFWVIFFGLLIIGGTYIVTLFPAEWERLNYGLTGTSAVLCSTWLMLKLEGKQFKDIGFVWKNTSLIKFIYGIGIGSFTFSFILIILLLSTSLQLSRNYSTFQLMDIIKYFSIIPLAFMEEMLFRSYPLVRLNEKFGTRISLLITTIAFTLYHIIIGWTIPAALWGPAIWGLVFGLSAQWSGGIAMPTGIHIALNVWQPIVGLSTGTFAALWKIDHREGSSAAQMQRADTIGMITQVTILLAILSLIEYYSRKNKKQHPRNL